MEEEGPIVSMILNMGSKPDGITCKVTSDKLYLNTDDDSLEITFQDFAAICEYVMTNSDLTADDPRLQLLKCVQSMTQVDGYNPGGKHLRSSAPPLKFDGKDCSALPGYTDPESGEAAFYSDNMKLEPKDLLTPDDEASDGHGVGYVDFDKPPTQEEVEEILKAQHPGMEIKWLEGTKTDLYWPEVEKVIAAIQKVFKVGGILTSDESRVCDFNVHKTKRGYEGAVKRLGKELGVEVSPKDYIVDIAKRMREAEKT